MNPKLVQLLLPSAVAVVMLILLFQLMGWTLLGGAILGSMIGLFIPALIVMVAFIILIFGLGLAGYMRVLIPVGLLILAWIIASLPGGGL